MRPPAGLCVPGWRSGAAYVSNTCKPRRKPRLNWLRKSRSALRKSSVSFSRAGGPLSGVALRRARACEPSERRLYRRAGFDFANPFPHPAIILLVGTQAAGQCPRCADAVIVEQGVFHLDHCVQEAYLSRMCHLSHPAFIGYDGVTQGV